jgi:hypothetical protein
MIEDLIIDGKRAQLLERQPIEFLLERSGSIECVHKVWEMWKRRGLVARLTAGTDNDHVWIWYEFASAEQCPDPCYGRYLMIRSLYEEGEANA